MDANIKELGDQCNALEFNLNVAVMELENHMNECNCDDAVWYNFVNIVGHHEIHKFCLNCGGYITKENADA
jgi:hypothetical protein